MKKVHIQHILTGGTISGCVPEYPEVERLLSRFNDAFNIDKYVIDSWSGYCVFSSVEVCQKDSREVTVEDRKKILDVVNESFNNGISNFLITHGTYTMPETGIYILENLSEEILANVNIVITGSMYPLNFIGSDALLNLGASLSSLINAETFWGVKICMHGKNWDPRSIVKDSEKLIFKEL